MKKRLPLVFWFASLAVLAIVAAVSLPWLPERIATHFNGAGQPNGWMSRQAWMISFLGTGLGVSTFEIGLLYAIRFFPPSMLNVPHADHWRSPEHYREACDFIFFHSFWLAGSLLLWFTGMHLLTIDANRSVPVALNPLGLGILTAAFLSGMAVWAVSLYRFFRNPEPQA